MKAENRAMLFCLTLLVAVPGLYALGEWIGGLPWAIGLPLVSTLATLLYAGRGGGPTLPPGAQPPGVQPPGVQPPGAQPPGAQVP